jgi:hypothetical protein
VGQFQLPNANLLTGESGIGKTWIAHAIAGAVAHGRNFAGQSTKRRPVWYFDAENPVVIVQRNLRELGIERTESLQVWGGWNSESPSGPDDPRVMNFAKQEQPLLIYDSLIAFNPGDEQSSTATRQVMEKFRELVNLDATVLILHHTGKSDGSQQYRGSSDIKAAVDMAYVVKIIAERDGKVYRLALECFKSRFAPKHDFWIELRQGEGFVAFENSQRGKTHADVMGAVREIILENPGLLSKELADIARKKALPKGKVEDALRDGDWRKESARGSGKRHYIDVPLEVPRAA